ncbi:hypothetical protein BT93_F1972 [Corymbia citriodora subsp. variegata]|nr:hypothetical protein BT93_F1972 [Corymbia citriodora subsp. variegata]
MMKRRCSTRSQLDLNQKGLASSLDIMSPWPQVSPGCGTVLSLVIENRLRSFVRTGEKPSRQVKAVWHYPIRSWCVWGKANQFPSILEANFHKFGYRRKV